MKSELALTVYSTLNNRFLHYGHYEFQDTVIVFLLVLNITCLMFQYPPMCLEERCRKLLLVSVSAHFIIYLFD